MRHFSVAYVFYAKVDNYLFKNITNIIDSYEITSLMTTTFTVELTDISIIFFDKIGVRLTQVSPKGTLKNPTSFFGNFLLGSPLYKYSLTLQRHFHVCRSVT